MYIKQALKTEALPPEIEVCGGLNGTCAVTDGMRPEGAMPDAGGVCKKHDSPAADGDQQASHTRAAGEPGDA